MRDYIDACLAQPTRPETLSALQVGLKAPPKLSTVIGIGPILTFHRDPFGNLHVQATSFEVRIDPTDETLVREKIPAIQSIATDVLSKRDWLGLCGLNEEMAVVSEIRDAVALLIPETRVHVRTAAVVARSVPR